MIPDLFGPVDPGQEVAPPVPDIPHVTAPLGAWALLDPITTTVNAMDPPNVGLPEELRKTSGIARATVVNPEEAVATTALYRLSPGKVKVAE